MNDDESHESIIFCIVEISCINRVAFHVSSFDYFFPKWSTRYAARPKTMHNFRPIVFISMSIRPIDKMARRENMSNVDVKWLIFIYCWVVLVFLTSEGFRRHRNNLHFNRKQCMRRCSCQNNKIHSKWGTSRPLSLCHSWRNRQCATLSSWVLYMTQGLMRNVLDGACRPGAINFQVCDICNE